MTKENLYEDICRARIELENALRKGSGKVNVLSLSCRLDSMISEYVKKSIRKK